jgi:radical SAM superfamily enzyme YgiQ (UPF0313 family)
MRVLLISPEGRFTAVGRKFKYPFPTACLPLLASLTPPDMEVRIVDEIVEDIDFGQEADLVGISLMTPMASRAYEIAARFREKGSKVVLGGIHPTAVPEEALQHADAVVVGEAEGNWPPLIQDFKAGRLQRLYRNLEFPQLSHLPPPRWDLMKSEKYFPITVLETTRGCPLDCDFCAVTTFYGGEFRLRPLPEVERDVRAVAEKPELTGKRRLMTPYRREMIFFADSNIIGQRRHAVQLLRMLQRYQVPWMSYSTVTIAKDPELLTLCQSSNCVGLAIGFESLSPDNLDRMGKGFNRPADYEEAIRRIRDHGIGIVASFILGLDGDDLSVFERTYDFIRRTRIESSFFLISTPLPGTRLRQRLLQEGRIFDFDWDHYDCTHVVFRPRQMSPEQLLEGVNWLWKETLSHRSIWGRLLGHSPRSSFYLGMNYGMRMLDRQLRPGGARLPRSR